jgi:hypothetical protein
MSAMLDRLERGTRAAGRHVLLAVEIAIAALRGIRRFHLRQGRQS